MKLRTAFAGLRPLCIVALIAGCSPSDPVGRDSEPLDETSTSAASTSPSTSPSTSAPSPDLVDAPDLGDREARDRSRSLEALRAVPFPVLLLPERFTAGAVITSGPVWYAMSYDDPRNVTVSVHATNNVHIEIDEGEEIPPPDARVRGVPARTSVDEGIRSVTWVADGVAYMVEVECWDVLQDPRCTAADFALEVAEDLVEAPR